MSSTGTASSTRRRRARNDANEAASSDLFQHDTSIQGSTAADAVSSASRRDNAVEEVSEANPNTDFRSGLRTSEVDPGSALSYSDMSSATGTTRGGAGGTELSTIRPGVNDESRGGNRTMQSGFQMPTGGAHSESDISSTAQTVIWGTDVNISQVMDRFKRFLLTFTLDDVTDEEPLRTGQALDSARPLYLQRLEDLAAAGESALDINCAHLQESRPDLYHQLITFPKEVIPACDAAAHALFVDRFRDARPDRQLQIRPYNCGKSRNLRNLDPEDLDQLVTVRGLVIRLSGLIPEMLRAEFACAVCGHTTSISCEKGRVAEPASCARCHAAHTSQLLHNRCIFVDKQMVKLQEAPEDMPASQTPHTVCLFAHEDLVEKVQPGDRVMVTGIYRAVPLRLSNRQRSLKAVYKTYVDVLHFKRVEEHRNSEDVVVDADADSATTSRNVRFLTPERILEVRKLAEKPDLYERLASAIAPSIYENEDVKKGILLQLFGGTRKDLTSAGRGNFRSEVNVLLCGDPGTSKSQLLSFVHKLSPRGQYTSGRGSSAVGLTAFVTKDPETRQITLQTGALVLADNGVCCIDEFDKMSDSTRSILHEVMEQQTLSIAKAGILCQLNARTSILAAANPVGSKWDAGKTIIDNIQLPHTLLSRFDMIFLILDPQDEVYDARLARHLVSLYYKGTKRAAMELEKQQNEKATATPTKAKRGRPAKSTKPTVATGPGAWATEDEQELDGAVNISLLRDYISYAKAICKPKLTEAASEYLVGEYVEMRKLGAGRGQVSAYPRQLESLVRMAEAHAKMRLSDKADVEDCREARRLQREALKQAAVDPVTGTIDVSILTTGVSNSMRKRREEMAQGIWQLLEEKPRVLTFAFSRVLEELRGRSERLVTRDAFEDGLNVLRNANRIDWAGNTIRRR